MVLRLLSLYLLVANTVFHLMYRIFSSCLTVKVLIISDILAGNYLCMYVCMLAIKDTFNINLIKLQFVVK